MSRCTLFAGLSAEEKRNAREAAVFAVAAIGFIPGPKPPLGY